MFAALLASLIVVTPLESLDLSRWSQGWQRPSARASVTGGPLTVRGRTYAEGVGSHAPAVATYRLDGRAQRIQGSVAVNDTGGGSVRFSLWGDGRRLWSSDVLRAGQDPVPFDVGLTGVKVLTLAVSDALDGNGGDHADWIGVRITHTGPPPQPLPAMKPLTLLPQRTRQTIDNFAASDSWTIEPLIRWPEAKRRSIARLLFDREKGAGLSGWRTNLGGGIDHETITNPLRTVDTYDAGEGKFDFSRCPGQQWFLREAARYGVERVVAYAITPPRRLTRNGHPNGTDGDGTTNLKPGAEDAYARFLVGASEHFLRQGIPITHISPINEPDYEWNGVPNPGSQEGSRASNPDIVRITTALAREIRNRGLQIRVLTPESSTPQRVYQKNSGMEAKYGAPYGDYAGLLKAEREWRREVNPVLAYHSYGSDGLGSMADLRRRMRESLSGLGGLEVWMTEYCQMGGPRGEGGWGRDTGMTLALNVARLMQIDLTIAEANAWQWWLAVSDADYKDGLIYVDDLDAEGGGDFFPTK
ncbi:MAG: glycoside hydrolase, partial [Fimbriimonadales bacterium]